MSSELAIRLTDADVSLPPVQWNQEEVEAWLNNRIEVYRGRAYNPEDMKDAKKDRAEVNRVEKELAAAQKKVQDLYSAPVEQFCAEMKRFRGIAKEIASDIDVQIKRAEEAEKEKRKEELQQVYLENVGDELSELIEFERILDSKWLNKSMALSTARKALMVRLETIRAEMENLRNLCREDFPEIQRVYLQNLSINDAISEHRRRQELRQAQERAEAARRDAQKAAAAAPIIQRPTQEQREAREEGQRQAETNRCITSDGKLDMEELRAQAQAAQPTFTRKIMVTYTAQQGRELADFMRSKGIKFEILV